MSEKLHTLYTFLVRRPQDKEAWPVVPFKDETRALAYPYRASHVVRLDIVEFERPVNVNGNDDKRPTEADTRKLDVKCEDNNE